MTEVKKFFIEDEFDLLGIVRLENDAIIETRYYFRGWIPLAEFVPDIVPEYVSGYTGRETLVRQYGIRPAITIRVAEDSSFDTNS